LPVPASIDEIDLEALAAAMNAQQQGGMPDFKQMVRLQRFLLEADADAVAALMARAADLDLGDAARKSLLAQLVQALAQKDPRRALDLAFSSPHLDVADRTWAYTSGFTGWMKKDPATALAWFDEKIAAGGFTSKSIDGRSLARIRFEAAALGHLLGSDPARARERLEALPEEHRREILQQGHLLKVNRETEAAFAALVRETLPADLQARAYASHAHALVRRDGFQGVGEFLETIEATPAERQAIAAQAANNKLMESGRKRQLPGAADLAELRAFAEGQAPAATEVITGEALAHFAYSSGMFEETAGLIRDLHAGNPNDDILVGFLQQSRFMSDRGAARDLAALITDPARRAAVLEKLEPPAP
ncbi:MAG: hypothetical protein HKN82_06080, partial [Akkermansiaceae bacterium]|nr:hypothetical protein [Akkermansiaceae bacterium]